MARFTKNTRSKEAFKVLMWDLNALYPAKPTIDQRYHYELLAGNLRDLFGLTKRQADKILAED